MQVPKTQGLKGPGGLPGPAEGERLEELHSFHFFENYKELLRKKVSISPPLSVASEPPSPRYPGHCHSSSAVTKCSPEKKKLGSSNCLKFTKMVNSIIITLFCIILISFAIPSRGPFWLLRRCVHNLHTEFLSKLGSVFQGTARLMYAGNCITRASEFECLHKQTGSQA